MNNKVKDSRNPNPDLLCSPHNFSNIVANKTAQRFLLEAKDVMKSADIFEFIYSTQVAWAEEMKERRANRRAYFIEKKVKHEPSFLDTLQKEQEYYDKNARDVATKAMYWLDEVRNQFIK